MGEFEWIDGIREKFSGLLPQDMEGIGDDCAVLPAGDKESLVITTDMLVENVHFVSDQISARDLGYKSLAVNLSDVAAMGAVPIGSFLSVGLPDRISETWRDAFLEGFRELSQKYNIPLLGGDTTSAEKLTVSVTALGKANHSHIKRRSAARAGDVVCVTGNLGDSATGLHLLKKQECFSTEEAILVKAHFCPEPDVKEGIWLGRQAEVRAMMDVSDGIASDLGHMLNASGVAAQIELLQIPISGTAKQVCRDNGWNAEELAVSGGEDYVLLLTVEKDRFNDLNKKYRTVFEKELTPIGEITEGAPQITWRRSGKPVTVNWKGFSHF